MRNFIITLLKKASGIFAICIAFLIFGINSEFVFQLFAFLLSVVLVPEILKGVELAPISKVLLTTLISLLGLFILLLTHGRGRLVFLYLIMQAAMIVVSRLRK